MALRALVVSFAVCSSAHAVERENVLIVLADDFGTTDLAGYDEATDAPYTPALDELARRGVRFRHAWSNPICSPTRACLQTGRHAKRTGIGTLVQHGSLALDPAEMTLPELVRAATGGAVACAYFGKWHLGNETVGYLAAPNVAGWPHFAGNLQSLVDHGETYDLWMKVDDGVASTSTTYNTTAIVDDAIQWIQSISATPATPMPWLCVLAFNAPHVPLHPPPAELHAVDLSQAGPPAIDPRPYFRAMLEAMDAELGRFLAALGPAIERTHVIFVGDNGSPAEVALPPIQPGQAKISLFEPGIRVPLVIAGPSVVAPGRDSGALVHVVDLFPTVLELLGVDPPTQTATGQPIDGRSLADVLANGPATAARQFVVSEIFAPNGLVPHQYEARAIRERRYKLIVSTTLFGAVTTERLYDLEQDPFETTNLLALPLVPLEVALVHARLKNELERFVAG